MIARPHRDFTTTIRRLSALLAAILTGTLAFGLTSAEWKYEQPFTVEATGALKIPLPPETLDHLQSDLRDLRIVAPNGSEVPFLIVRPRPANRRVTEVNRFGVELVDQSTVVSITTGTNDPIESVFLACPAPSFLKPVRIEISSDGVQWEKLSEGTPLFRQDHAENLRLGLGLRRVAQLRLTLNDQRTAPIVVTGARLVLANTDTAATENQPLHIVRTEEFLGESVSTVDLGAAHLDLSSLTVTASDGLFMRNVTVSVPELHDTEVVERRLGNGAIFRVALEGLEPAAQLDVPLEVTAPSRQLTVHIENGDSPPLHLQSISAQVRPAYVIFSASASGAYQFLSGNSQTGAAHYDLAALSAELNRLPVSKANSSSVVTNADYHQSDPLAGLTLEGAALDVAPWHYRRAVSFTHPGVVELDLDQTVLADAQAELGDVRLWRNGKQVPYVLERTQLVRANAVSLTSITDPKRPSFSRWKIDLGRTALPVMRLSLATSATLFDRQFRLFEQLTDSRGDAYDQTLSTEEWIRRPGAPARPLIFALAGRPQTTTLWIETDNGDNPPITLEKAEVYFPVTRLYFKSNTADPVTLLYGNRDASAPHYDLGLVANQLLGADKEVGKLDAEAGGNAPSTSSPLAGISGGVIFWGALGVVVILLLIVVAKLLPKPPSS